MVPEFLEGAPAWALNIFWAGLAIGAVWFTLRSVIAGAKVESKVIETTGAATPTKQITETPATSLGAGSLAIIGGSLLERQFHEDYLETGRRIAAALEPIGRAADLMPRLVVLLERRLERDEEADTKAEIQRQARELAAEIERERERRAKAGPG